ncbi:hypothetical protein [Prosthecobacter sp.]|uniref:hypothetical protein n=1 Tax=Prosthecobacter sp. TaxID=1965333 RepID=UPI003783FFA9
MLRPALLAIHALAAAWGVHAAEPAALPLDIQQRLEALKSGFDSFVLKNVKTPYEEGLKALNAKVKPALERESTMAAKKKDLDTLVRIKADLERIEKGLLLTGAESPPPDSLKNVYSAYKSELAKIEPAMKRSLADAKLRYDKGLGQIQDELTAAQNVEGALQVKQLREGLVKMTDATTATEPKKQEAADAGTSSPRNMEWENALVGRWIFKAGDFAMNKELLRDGTVVSPQIPGKWKIVGNTLRVDYSNGAWAEFDLPAKEGKMKGKSYKNEDMTAEKITQ